MAWVGMNPSEVKAQGNTLGDQAQAIRKLINKIDNEVSTIKSNWNGQDSEQFEKQWSGTHKGELEKAQKLLENMAEKVEHEMKEQDSTSSSF